MVARINRTTNSPGDSRNVVPAKPTARSRVTNGKQLFLGADGRSREARRWRDVHTDLLAQTGGAHAQLCRSLASLIVQRERIDAALARGENIDTGDLVRITGAINRTFSQVGLTASCPEPTGDMTDAVLAAMRGAA